MDEIRIPASVNTNSGNGGKIGMARRTRLVDGMSVKPRTHPISRFGATESINCWADSNDVDAARQNVHRHYDLGNSFYQLWLDREMVYTCAYFPRPDASLEEAQDAKLDLVCRKLCLRPGETVVDLGSSGWRRLTWLISV
jgi:hypothetical protein